MAPDQIRVSGTALEVFSYGVGPLVKHSPLCSRGRMWTPTKTLSADDGGTGLHTARPHRLPCHASSPTMNNTGNAAKCNLSNYLLITHLLPVHIPLFGGITNNEQRWQCWKIQPFQLFTYYCLPVSLVWCHRWQCCKMQPFQLFTYDCLSIDDDELMLNVLRCQLTY